jgi:cell division initiation protein
MIDLTPLEVRKKKGDFRRIMRGYDPALVDDFLDLVADRLEEVVRENLTLTERVGRQDQQVAEYRERERALTEALVTAQEMREEMRQQTSREADLVKRAAEQQAADLRSRTEHELAHLRAQVEQEVAQLRSAAQQESAQLRSAAQQETAELRSARRQEQVREEEAIRQLRVRHEQFLGTYRALLERELAELSVATRSLGLAAAAAAGADTAVAAGADTGTVPAAAEEGHAAVATSLSDASPAPDVEDAEPTHPSEAGFQLRDEVLAEDPGLADFRVESAAVSAEAQLFTVRPAEPSQPAAPPTTADTGPMFPEDDEAGAMFRILDEDDVPAELAEFEDFNDLDLDDFDLGGLDDLAGFEAEPLEPFAPEPFTPESDAPVSDAPESYAPESYAETDAPALDAPEPRPYESFASLESLVDADDMQDAWHSIAPAGDPLDMGAGRDDEEAGPAASAGEAGAADSWDPMQDAFEMYDHIAIDPVDDGVPGPIGLAQSADDTAQSEQDDGRSALLRNAEAAGFRLGDDLEDELLLEDAVMEDAAEDDADDDGWLPSLLDDEK